MKIRTGHVSNSSSSSFILQGKDDISKLNIPCIELNHAQILVIEKTLSEFTWNKKDKVYLTPMINDSCDNYFRAKWGTDLDDNAHTVFGCFMSEEQEEVHFDSTDYVDGNWKEPYGVSDFEIIGEVDGRQVYLRKEVK